VTTKKKFEPTPCEHCGKKGCEGDCPAGLAAIRASNERVARVSHDEDFDTMANWDLSSLDVDNPQEG
jgi:hypothetical protein